MNITTLAHPLLAALLLLGAADSFAEALAQTEVVRSDAVGSVIVDGKVEAERQAIIATQTAGRILERLVEAGDAVTKGQLLLRIDDRETRQQETAYIAQLAAAEAHLAQTKLDRDRNAAMLQKKLIGQAAYDQSETAYRAALAEVRAQRASTELSTTQRSFTQVLSPYNGLVAAVNVNVGDLAMPGKAVMTVYDPAAFRVFANLSVSVLNRWQREESMKVSLPQGEVVLPTQVMVLPQTDPVAQQVVVRLDLPAELSGLLPGMFVKVQVPVIADARLLVPLAAVLRRGEMTAVYVLRDGMPPQLRQVRLGKTVRLGETMVDQIEILAGVEAGEQVALEPIKAAAVRVQSTGIGQ